MEAEKKGCDSPRLSQPRAADCIRPLRAQLCVTHKYDPKAVLAASKGTTPAFQTHNRPQTEPPVGELVFEGNSQQPFLMRQNLATHLARETNKDLTFVQTETQYFY